MAHTKCGPINRWNEIYNEDDDERGMMKVKFGDERTKGLFILFSADLSMRP